VRRLSQRDTLPGHAAGATISEGTVIVQSKPVGHRARQRKAGRDARRTGCGIHDVSIRVSRRCAGQGLCDRVAVADGGPSVSEAHRRSGVRRSRSFVPLADLKNLVFTAWDSIPDDAYTAAVNGRRAGPAHEHLEPIKDFPPGHQAAPPPHSTSTT